MKGELCGWWIVDCGLWWIVGLGEAFWLSLGVWDMLVASVQSSGLDFQTFSSPIEWVCELGGHKYSSVVKIQMLD